ncbi:hypothetical protein BVC80_8349g1 [Macleaya cordata]|uniref:Late embryogenesis abundant protein n=1 Tax=Macleaya cordata TaxID=56857 RepID=A0A200QAY1_MACCD|nr:hypothetical protein BVC80_8349g1 [Macleaya cordata]
MEERVKSFSDLHQNQQPLPPPPPPQASFPIATSQGTYIVQVPKTQIYRVPPPENALIVERHLNPVNQKNPRWSFLFWFFIVVAIVVVVVGICAAIIYFSINPKSPTFVVSKVIVQNQNSHNHLSDPPQYHITLSSENPNEGMGIIYQDGGSSKLSFKQKEIATGKPPSLYQGNKDIKAIRFDLTGLNVVLPHEIIKSMKGGGNNASKKASVSLSLSVNVPVKMKIAFIKSWNMNMAITCNFRVSSLAKDIHVLSEDCHTKL